MASDDDNFFSRWSRRKVQVRQGVQMPEPAPPRPVPATEVLIPRVEAAASALTESPVTTGPPAGPVSPPPPPPPTLDEVAQLHAGSDFRRFVAPGVDSGVKNAALKKLFTDPHYNVMDGLDTYVDDYNRPDPLPESWLRRMSQSATLGLFDNDERSAGGEPPVTSDTGAFPIEAATVAPPLPTTEDPVSHEDPDLRLQPHDAAGPEGAGGRAGPDAGREH